MEWVVPFAGFLAVVCGLMELLSICRIFINKKKVLQTGEEVQGKILKYYRPYPTYFPYIFLCPKVKIRHKGKTVELYSSFALRMAQHEIGSSLIWIYSDQFPKILIPKQTDKNEFKLPPYEIRRGIVALLSGTCLLLWQ